MVLVAPGLMAIPRELEQPTTIRNKQRLRRRQMVSSSRQSPVLQLRWPFPQMVNWNKAASLRQCRMGAPLPKTEFQSPSENVQIRTGINSTFYRHRAIPRIFGRNSDADQMDKQDCPPPVLKSHFRTKKTDRAGPILATGEGEPLRVGLAVRIQAFVAAGFDLQVDCPDLAMGHIFSMRALIFLSFANGQPSTSRCLITRSETSPLNECAGSILEQQRRPATLDVPLAHIVDIKFAGRPASSRSRPRIHVTLMNDICSRR
jgi:hypothetical protein